MMHLRSEGGLDGLYRRTGQLKGTRAMAENH